jgi:hypothetical protein
MTNTLIMELLRNKAINKETKMALYIALGGLTALGIGFCLSQLYQRKKYNTLNRKHTNLVNLTNARVLDHSRIVTEKDNKIVEQEAIIKELQDGDIVIQNNKNAQFIKVVNDLKTL